MRVRACNVVWMLSDCATGSSCTQHFGRLINTPMARPWLLLLASFLLFATASASTELLNQPGVLMHSPAASVWCGPSEFSINTLSINASLVDGGDMSGWARGNRHASEGLVKGKIVLVSITKIFFYDDPSEAYLTLADMVHLRLLFLMMHSNQNRGTESTSVAGKPGICLLQEIRQCSLRRSAGSTESLCGRCCLARATTLFTCVYPLTKMHGLTALAPGHGFLCCEFSYRLATSALRLPHAGSPATG